ncbi:hypothetical protein Sa4125_35200 [Aureimonas sp. SA4125]|uniref:SHOCT domain-containing protein n=1 Tax=Aureimonas sp. SA4125 TaxID=2826993 RepID=UPI001CC7DB84|nr:SHOCT domain-containing protein [Aureimonas sp. SA4125]BDA85978.1 hypothetical protein Sa4125_35200 [Aureimonas sp. SA4125]
MTEQWSSEAKRKIADIAAKNGFSEEAGLAMAEAISRGVGSMAQFNHRDLGGQGQWVRGGMLMIADMFNDGLKSRVRNLAETLAEAAQRGAIQPKPGGDGADNQGSESAGDARGGLGSGARGSWWPADLGEPASSGAQDGMRYAVFPEARRVVVERDGKVTVHDSGDHRIGGASQHQGSSSSLRFSSQHGAVGLETLPEVRHGSAKPEKADDDLHGAASHRSADASAGRIEKGVDAPHRSLPETFPPNATGSRLDGKDPLELIRKLAELRDAGIITEDEFTAKKTELLARL